MWYSLARKFLFQLDAEKSHYLALNLLKLGTFPWLTKRRLANFPQRPVKLWGLTFPNPVGLAAGFDKNGDYIEPLQSLGFGFIEVGTVTPRPQVGNLKPRLFRIPAASAIINRMGFNNFGVDHLVEKLQQRRLPGIIGANIGKNSDTPLEDAAKDYCFCLRKVYPHVDYVTINISSPNTPGLRNLQTGYFLNNLLSALEQVRIELIAQGLTKKPILLKIDPDQPDEALHEMVNIILQHAIDGIIATNTTVNHRLVAHLPHGHEVGGLSGEPLFLRSTQVLQKLAQLLEGRLPVIAAGGILTPEEALEKLSCGASLVQVYTGLIYRGPGLVREIVEKIGTAE